MEGVEHPMAEAIFGAVVQNVDISEAIAGDLLNSMSLRIHSAMNYAKNHYHLGLPGGVYGNANMVSDEDLVTIIATDLDVTNGVVVDYNILDTMTLELVVLPLLEGRRAYNFNKNIITVYPVGMSVPVGATVSIFSIAPAIDDIDISIVYRIFRPEVVDGLPEYLEYFEELFTPIPGIKIGQLYYLVKYFELDGEGVPIDSFKWWYYDPTTEVYPLLNSTNSDDLDNSFLPVVPIRYENITLNQAAHEDTPLYITSKRLLTRLGITFDQLADFIDSNPDIAEIDHAYVMFGVDLQTTNNASIYYLAEFFDHLSALAYSDQYNFINKLQQSNNLSTNTYNFDSTINPIPIDEGFNYTGEVIIDAAIVNNDAQISLIEHGLNTGVTYRYITTAIKAGSIGDVGTATKDTISGYESIRQDQWGYTLVDTSTLILKVQITPTAYKEIVVVGLIHNNKISEGIHRTSLYDVITNSDNHNFIIPIHYGISKRLPLFQRTMLYEESLQLIINSYVWTKVKWYETKLFQFVVLVVAIIITIWSVGSAAKVGYAAYAAAVKAGAATVAAALVATAIALAPIILKKAALAILIGLIMDIVVNAIGGEWAIVLAVVVAVYAVTRGDASKISVLGQTIPTAQACLAISTALLKSTGNYFVEGIEQIQQQIIELESEAEKQSKEIDRVTELLDTRSMINPLDFLIAPQFISVPDESPDAFYNRTIHSGNIGVVTLDVIGNYNEMLLQLHKTNSAY